MGIPVLVLTDAEDDVEAISRCLRNAGQPAHCRRVARLNTLHDVLTEARAQLLCVLKDGDSDVLAKAADYRDRCAPNLPILAIAGNVDEDAITRAMLEGAQDLVSLEQPERLSAVALRELRAYEARCELEHARIENDKLSEQLAGLIDESTAHIVYASEGIVINVNPAWLGLFGFAEASDLVGTPVLDLFDPESRAAIKGALIACTDGKWHGPEIPVRVLSSDGSSLRVNATLQQSHHDGEQCVRIRMDQDRPVVPELEQTGRHPVTGFFQRDRFISELNEFLDRPSTSGVSMVAYLRLDAMGATRDTLDPVTSDRLTADMGAMLSKSVKPGDLYGQFGGDIFMALLTRGTRDDARAWAENLRRKVGNHVFEAGSKSLSLTCTIGLAPVDRHTDTVNSLMEKAQQAFRDGRNRGGDRVMLLDDAEETVSAVSADELKQALMSDGFRLVYQPVASMLGKSRDMFDVLIRMRGPNDTDIMPADFLPTARQAGLMKNIDRWVTVNSINFCRQNSDTQLFIRLSENSFADTTFVPWMAKQLDAGKINTGQLVFQIPEKLIEDRVKEAQKLARQLQAIGCTFALEHFGLGNRPLQTLEHVPAQIIKIDGSLMEGLIDDREVQRKVRLYVEAARDRDIQTIAERVEDANTMAVLWQLGVEFIQGYYVQGPEEIVLETDAVSA